MSEKKPVQITDKNGKQTTVWKSVEVSRSDLRLGGAKPFQFANDDAARESKQKGFLADFSHDARMVIPNADRLEIGGDEDMSAVIVRATTNDGEVIWDASKDGFDENIDNLNRALRNMEFDRGAREGYIGIVTRNTEGVSKKAVYTVDLDGIEDYVS